MKHGLGRKPLGGTLAFVLAVTLLLPGVTSMSIDPTATASPTAVSDINETETANVEESPPGDNGTRTDEESAEEDALALFSLLVKRAVDEEIADVGEEEKSETDLVDEDKFSISDFPKLLKPLIDAFSDESRSEAPSKDDFLSWFPSLKDLLEPNKPKGTEATSSATRSGRRSSLSTTTEPPPPTTSASAQPPEHEILASSQLDALATTVPTITSPPISITKPPVSIPPEDSASAESSEMDF
ncbi:uncharacterized protein LOC143831544 [Paroedura picta]|uniref:uncharacterized protein LOC143831544 n=1 Tax=Paroedura picta TaxID=143630 RepID=UPI0010144BBA